MFVKACFVELIYDLFWRMFCVCLRRICILLLGGMFCVWLLGPVDLRYSSSPMFPYWFSICMIYPLLKVDNDVHISIVLLSISVFRSFNICLIYLVASVLDACTFAMLYLLDELTPLSCNDLVSCYSFWLKSLFLSGKIIATTALFCFLFAGTVFFYPFTLSLHVFLELMWVSHR